MKKARMEKGITLISLIITIIVLSVVEVVALTSIQGDGMILHAKKASSNHDKGKKEEEKELSKTQYELVRVKFEQAKADGTTTARTPDEYVLEKVYGVKIKIGDYVTYNPGSYTHKPDVSKGAGTGKIEGNSDTRYKLSTNSLRTQTNLSWRVLGANSKGELELISADPTSQKLYLANDKGYVYGEENLNNYCNDLYGKGKYATGARSLNLDDINKLTNYNPNTSSGYGKKWIYRATEKSSFIEYSEDGGKTWDINDRSLPRTFRLPEERTAISIKNPGSRELINSCYGYNIANNLTTDDGFTETESKAISNMITKGTTNSNINQWIASRCILCASDSAAFYVRSLYSGNVYYDRLFTGGESFFCWNYRVRPVVSISTNVKLTRSGSAWQISK